MSINIGNNNKIKNSKIIENEVVINNDKDKKWHEQHPILIAIITGVIAGVVLMFSCWGDIVNFIENLFGGIYG